MNGVIVFVAAFRECIQFYKDKIGLKVLMEKPGIVRFQFGSMYLQVEDGEAFKVSPTTSVILREDVPSIPAKREELSEKGIKLEVHDLEWGEIGFVYDPGGNKVEYFRQK
jgi:lactoylglutathione lyase